MIRDISQEEDLTNRTIRIGLIQRLLFYRIPFIILIIYSLFLINYISFGYLCFGLLLFNLEMEKYFSRNTGLKTSRYTKLRDLVTFSNKRICVYYLLLIFTMLVFIAKFVVLLMSYYYKESYEHLKSHIEPENFELYFIKERSSKNLYMTFLPNLGVFLITGMTILFQSYYAKIKRETFGSLKQGPIIRYFLILSIMSIALFIGIVKVSIVGVIFISTIVIYFVIWSNVHRSNRAQFYFFAKVLQVFSVLVILVIQIASIDTVKEFLLKILQEQKMTFAFLGIIDLHKLFGPERIEVFLSFFLLLIDRSIGYLLYWCSIRGCSHDYALC